MKGELLPEKDIQLPIHQNISSISEPRSSIINQEFDSSQIEYDDAKDLPDLD